MEDLITAKTDKEEGEITDCDGEDNQEDSVANSSHTAKESKRNKIEFPRTNFRNNSRGNHFGFSQKDCRHRPRTKCIRNFKTSRGCGYKNYSQKDDLRQTLMRKSIKSSKFMINRQDFPSFVRSSRTNEDNSGLRPSLQRLDEIIKQLDEEDIIIRRKQNILSHYDSFRMNWRGLPLSGRSTSTNKANSELRSSLRRLNGIRKQLAEEKRIIRQKENRLSNHAEEAEGSRTVETRRQSSSWNNLSIIDNERADAYNSIKSSNVGKRANAGAGWRKQLESEALLTRQKSKLGKRLALPKQWDYNSFNQELTQSTQDRPEISETFPYTHLHKKQPLWSRDEVDSDTRKIEIVQNDEPRNVCQKANPYYNTRQQLTTAATPVNYLPERFCRKAAYASSRDDEDQIAKRLHKIRYSKNRYQSKNKQQERPSSPSFVTSSLSSVKVGFHETGYHDGHDETFSPVLKDGRGSRKAKYTNSPRMLNSNHPQFRLNQTFTKESFSEILSTPPRRYSCMESSDYINYSESMYPSDIDCPSSSYEPHASRDDAGYLSHCSSATLFDFDLYHWTPAKKIKTDSPSPKIQTSKRPTTGLINVPTADSDLRYDNNLEVDEDIAAQRKNPIKAVEANKKISIKESASQDKQVLIKKQMIEQKKLILRKREEELRKQIAELKKNKTPGLNNKNVTVPCAYEEPRSSKPVSH